MRSLEDAQRAAAGAYEDFAAAHAALRARAEQFAGRRPPRAVLIVEDDAAAAELLERILIDGIDGLDVRVARNARQGRAALIGVPEQDLPGCAIIDCNLGDGYGWELANEAPRSVRIVLISAAMEPHLFARLAAGVYAVRLQKPIGIDDLLHVVREQLEIAPSSALPVRGPADSALDRAEDVGAMVDSEQAPTVRRHD